MVWMGVPFARRPGSVMGSHQLVIHCVETHLARAAAHVQLLAYQPERGRIVGSLEDHMAIAMQFDLLPDGQVIGHLWQQL